jgi:hypothetical protein
MELLHVEKVLSCGLHLFVKTVGNIEQALLCKYVFGKLLADYLLTTQRFKKFSLQFTALHLLLIKGMET